MVSPLWVNCGRRSAGSAKLKEVRAHRAGPIGDMGTACQEIGPANISLQLTPKVRLWFTGVPVAGVRFAQMMRRGN